jgi:hypothetical protein
MEEIQPDDVTTGTEALQLIGDGEIAFTLPLTPAELKLTFTALHSLLDDFGHDEHELAEIVRGVLDKLPDEHSIRAITIR